MGIWSCHLVLLTHQSHWRMTLQVLRGHQLYAKFSKCEFWRRIQTFLCHVVSDKCVKVGPEKIESVKNWLRHLSPKDIKSFVSLANYYRRFVEVFSAIVDPLTALTMEKEKFE